MKELIVGSVRSPNRVRRHLHNTRNIIIFLDYMPKVQDCVKTFLFVETKDINMKYGMRFPASLRVQHSGKVYFFDSPEEASE
ncbi:hypothetical protein NDU88_010365 [Pleurodeles waltl]|uniref:Uncharacterized protein n=1 Tax=Pleurodeles waltl TaxID=8319 RepID=A0AAV7R009_PLEWA|nr:hypothetical protein NDU88_010365 [Pleurodeles waltl]